MRDRGHLIVSLLIGLPIPALLAWWFIADPPLPWRSLAIAMGMGMIVGLFMFFWARQPDQPKRDRIIVWMLFALNCGPTVCLLVVEGIQKALSK